ncbi:MAG: TM1812 family CRISPR-associated protein [Gemmataceae bacterium]|nr:TM1812 family CRISPR-associated protein [Gemmataceae bacterium]MDW8265799.1 TM1812 family CRISPR-associated protein [Gemmataceae bacterium]
MRLVSFLGTGNYGETIYNLEGQTHRTRYVVEALTRFLRPQEISVIATEEAWNQHGLALTSLLQADGHPSPRRVPVPTGGEPHQLWQMFGAIVEELRTAKPIVCLDITHGFRMQPFFAAACVQYVQAVLPDPPAVRVFYGEYRPSAPESPIWELTPFLDVLAWSRGLMMFLRTGRADDVAEPTEAVGRELARQWALGGKQGPEPSLKRFANALRAFGDDLTTIRTGSLLLGHAKAPSSAERLLEAIQHARRELHQHVPALAHVLDQVEDMARPLSTGGARFSSRDGQQALIALARLYQRMSRFSEAVSILREGWISLDAPPSADNPGPDMTSDSREQQTKRWQATCTDSRTVSEVRNDLQHAGFKPFPQDRAWFERQLNTLLKKWEQAISAQGNATTSQPQTSE